jgi:hypothetical protein
MMSGKMADKGRKPGKGVDADKLAEALRRAEEAVLRDGKTREEEAKKEKEPKSHEPVELDDSHFTKKEPKPARKPEPKPVESPEPIPVKKPEKKASKGIDLDSVLFGDKPQKKPAAKPVQLPKQEPVPPMVDMSKKEEPAPKKPAAPAKKLPDRPPPNLGFGELNLSKGPTDSPELELSAMSEDPVERPAAPAPAPEAPAAPPPVERPSDSRLPMRDPSKEYVPFVPKSSFGRQIKIFLLVVLILAAIGGGVYGFIKWRESVAAAEAAEKAKIESSSRDSLMDDTFKKEKYK